MTINALGAISLAAGLMAAAPVFGQTIVNAQQAGLTANSSTVTVSRVPVQVGTGAPSYFDVVINLTPTMSGSTVTGLKANTKSSSPSQDLISDGFIPGTYMDGYGSTYTVGGGSGPSGQTNWSVAATGCPTSCITSATWDTDDGPNNPEYPLLEKYKIKTTLYGFGASGGEINFMSPFNSGYLIGAVQSGNTLTIASFEDGNGAYQNSPTATITLYFLHS